MESWKSHIISRRIYRPVSEKFQFQAWTSGISFPQKHPDLLWNNPLTPPTQCITRALSWANRKKQEVDRPPASTSKRKNEWMCSSIPLFAFKTCSRTSSSWPYSEIKYVCFCLKCARSQSSTAKWTRTALFWVITQPVGIISYQSFRTTYRSHFHQLKNQNDSWILDPWIWNR